MPIYVYVESVFLGSAQQTEAFVPRVARKHLFTGGRDMVRSSILCEPSRIGRHAHTKIVLL